MLQADQSKEQSNACGDAELQIHRKSIDQPGAQGRKRQREKVDAGDEHAPKRKLPVAAKLRHDGKGKIGVEPHAGSERDRAYSPMTMEPAAEARQAARDTAPTSMPAF